MPACDRRAVIDDELAAIVQGRSLSDRQEAPTGLQRKVRKLIAEELEGVLASGVGDGSGGGDAGGHLPSLRPLSSSPLARRSAAASASGVGFGRSAPPTPSKSLSAPQLGALSLLTMGTMGGKPLRPPKSAASSRDANGCPKATMSPPAGRLTRQVMQQRNAYGGMVADAPGFTVQLDSAPLLPSKFRTISRSIWNMNEEYRSYPEVSEAADSWIDPKVPGPVTRAFMNPRDDFCIYREEVAKPGNKGIMRKSGPPGKKHGEE